MLQLDNLLVPSGNFKLLLTAISLKSCGWRHLLPVWLNQRGALFVYDARLSEDFGLRWKFLLLEISDSGRALHELELRNVVNRVCQVFLPALFLLTHVVSWASRCDPSWHVQRVFGSVYFVLDCFWHFHVQGCHFASCKSPELWDLSGYLWFVVRILRNINRVVLYVLQPVWWPFVFWFRHYLARLEVRRNNRLKLFDFFLQEFEMALLVCLVAGIFQLSFEHFHLWFNFSFLGESKVRVQELSLSIIVIHVGLVFMLKVFVICRDSSGSL